MQTHISDQHLRSVTGLSPEGKPGPDSPRCINIDGGWKFQYSPFMIGDELSGKSADAV